MPSSARFQPERLSATPSSTITPPTSIRPSGNGWLPPHPRWDLPLHADLCLLAQRAVEGFFATLIEKRRLKRGKSSDPSSISKRRSIWFLEDHNAESKPFEWVADPDKIIAAVRRGHQMLDSIH